MECVGDQHHGSPPRCALRLQGPSWSHGWSCWLITCIPTGPHWLLPGRLRNGGPLREYRMAPPASAIVSYVMFYRHTRVLARLQRCG